ncbi:MAG: hypothetical protein ACKVOH_01180 [Chlamydiales bacterium]
MIPLLYRAGLIVKTDVCIALRRPDAELLYFPTHIVKAAGDQCSTYHIDRQCWEEIFVFPRGGPLSLTKFGRDHCAVTEGDSTLVIDVPRAIEVAKFEDVNVRLHTGSYYYIDQGAKLEILSRSTDQVVSSLRKEPETKIFLVSEQDHRVALALGQSGQQYILIVDIQNQNILLEEGGIENIEGIEFVGENLFIYQHGTGSYTEVGFYNFTTQQTYVSSARFSSSPGAFIPSYQGDKILLFSLNERDSVAVFNMNTTTIERSVKCDKHLNTALLCADRLITYSTSGNLCIYDCGTGQRLFHLACDIFPDFDLDRTLPNIQDNILVIKAFVGDRADIFLIDVKKGEVLRTIPTDQRHSMVYFSDFIVQECFHPNRSLSGPSARVASYSFF